MLGMADISATGFNALHGQCFVEWYGVRQVQETVFALFSLLSSWSEKVYQIDHSKKWIIQMYTSHVCT